MVTSLGLQGWYRRRNCRSFVKVLSKFCRSDVDALSKFCRCFVEVLSTHCPEEVMSKFRRRHLEVLSQRCRRFVTSLSKVHQSCVKVWPLRYQMPGSYFQPKVRTMLHYVALFRSGPLAAAPFFSPYHIPQVL